MKIQTFAAVYVGSYEMEMKVYELSSVYGLKGIDHVRHHLDLGKDTFDDGLINSETIDEVCRILEGFREIMQEYRVDFHQAYATSAIREAKNRIHILDQIRIRCGFQVEVLSNSEQRYLGYKAIASQEADFNKIIQKGTAIVDMGGGSSQFSLFDKDSLISTQNIRWGFVRLREAIIKMESLTTDLDKLVNELIDEEIRHYKKLYLKERKIHNIIAVCDYISCLVPVMTKKEDRSYLTREEFLQLYDQLIYRSLDEIAELLHLPYENAAFVLPSLVLYKRFVEVTGAEMIWAPGITLSDGVAYDFAERAKIIKSKHNFEDDILAFAKNIAKRYQSNKNHTNHMVFMAHRIFDSMKKAHGLGKRERLLLEICVILHDCGKYISINNAARCSYNIIMSTEIIGLSHLERVMVANIVKFSTESFKYYDDMEEDLSEEAYLLVSKLTALLRMIIAMDISHNQKFEDIKVSLKEKKLQIVVSTVDDISLESKMFQYQADFFEKIYSIRPELRQKKYL